MSATVMNPANNIGFVVKMEHPFYHVLEDIRRKLVPTSMQRSTVLQSVTEMDFRDVFSSEAEAGEQGMSFREYSPRVFAVLRHFWGVDPTDFLDAFANTAVPFRSHTQHTRGFGGLGSVFYCPSGRFVIKFLNQTEFQWLLDFLPSYYNHFYDMHRQGIKSFLPKILCVYRIRYNEEQFFVYVTNNIFWTVDAMDAKFCLKGNFPAEEPDPDGTLDIPIDFLASVGNPAAQQGNSGLSSSNHAIILGTKGKADFMRSLQKDIGFLKGWMIVDYSFLVGVHRIRPSEYEDIKLRRTLSLEFELLNAVAGGEDNHSMLRYRFGFVDITRTMTPMVGQLLRALLTRLTCFLRKY